MEGNLIITVGISNSGKSTWAREQVKADPQNVLLVNRDKIRELIFGYTEESISEYYEQEGLGKFEKEVTKYEDTLIYEGLEAGKTVIVDATHLELKYLERFKYWNVPTKLEVFDVSLGEAIRRDVKRTRSVGVDVIKKQLQKFRSLIIAQRGVFDFIDFTPVEFNNDSSKPPCYILDLDGTIAEKGDRSPFDWKRVGEDSVIENIAKLWRDLSSNKLNPTLIICTGRDGVCLEECKSWLYKHNINYHGIYIRRENDMRPDWVVKEEFWREIAKNRYIVGLIDDRLQVVRRARALGLTVLHVAHNNF